MRYTVKHLPEDFQKPTSERAKAYVDAGYSKYGYTRTKSIEYNPSFGNRGARWVENVEDGLRFVDNADKIVRLSHTGWYTDNYQSETIKGQVYQLPARHGKTQYVPAVNDPNNDNSAILYFGDVTEDKEDAARLADRHAERNAEEEREYQAKDEAERRIEEIDEEIKSIYVVFRKDAKALKTAARTSPEVKELVTRDWARVKQEIHKLRAERIKVEREGINYY